MSKRYTEWMSNNQVVNGLKEEIKKSGVPLELRTKKFLKDNGFSARSMRYQSETLSAGMPMSWGGQWRELDLNAFKLQPQIEVGDTKVQIMSYLIGDCKYSSEKDLFVFEHSDRENVLNHLLPIKVNGQNLLPFPLDHHFKFPLIAEKAIHVNVDKKGKSEGNYSDELVHDACEAILTATSFFVNRLRTSRRYEYLGFSKKSEIGNLWKEELKSGRVEYIQYAGGQIISDGFIDKFLKEKFNPKVMLKDFPYLSIDIVIPLVVFDENRGIVKGELDEDNNIVGFEDVGFCLYPYISENADKFDNILEGYFNFPVILSSFSSLDRVMKIIDEGIKMTIDDLKRRLEETPSLIAKEMMFNRHI